MSNIFVWLGRFGFLIYLIYLYFKPNPTMHDLVIIGVNIYLEIIFPQLISFLENLTKKIKDLK